MQKWNVELNTGGVLNTHFLKTVPALPFKTVVWTNSEPEIAFLWTYVNTEVIPQRCTVDIKCALTLAKPYSKTMYLSIFQSLGTKRIVQVRSMRLKCFGSVLWQWLQLGLFTAPFCASAVVLMLPIQLHENYYTTLHEANERQESADYCLLLIVNVQEIADHPGYNSQCLTLSLILRNQITLKWTKWEEDSCRFSQERLTRQAQLKVRPCDAQKNWEKQNKN